MKIGISGYFGYGNFGDEIFLKTWEQIFSGHTVQALKDENEKLSSFDKIIIGGGDLIIPNFFTNAYWREHFFEKDTYVYGVGIPNNVKMKEDEFNKYIKFIKKCKMISFRDQWSYDFAVSNNIYNDSMGVVEDIAWAYEPKESDISHINIDERMVGISIRPAKILSYDNVLELCKHIVDLGYNILVIPLQPSHNKNWSDREYNMRLVNDINKYIDENNKKAFIDITPKDLTIDQTIACLSKISIYVTERMHGMLMSLKSHTNTMTIGKSNKFFRLAEKFDLDSHLCDDGLENLINTFNHVKDNGIESRISDIDNVVKKSKKNLLDFAEKILKGGNEIMEWNKIKYKCQFPQRLEQINTMINDGDSVLDIGCGDKYLKSILNKKCIYNAIDLLNDSKDDDIIECDLNGELVDLDKVYDVAVLSGVLEYVQDIDKVIRWIQKYAKKIIVSYSTLEGYGSCLKNKNPNLNILSEGELKDVFKNNRFNLINTIPTVLNQIIFVYENDEDIIVVEKSKYSDKECIMPDIIPDIINEVKEKIKDEKDIKKNTSNVKKNKNKTSKKKKS